MISLKEHQIQKAIIKWASYHPILSKYLIAIENERKTTIIQGRNRKLMGVKSGVSDLFLAYPCNGKHGLWIELKRDTKSKVSENQEMWISYMLILGYQAKIAYGFDEAVKYLTDYLS